MLNQPQFESRCSLAAFDCPAGKLARSHCFYTGGCTHLRKNLAELKNILKLVFSGYVETEKRKPKQLVFFLLKMLLFLLLIKSLSIGLIFLLSRLNIFEVPTNLNRIRFQDFNDIEILLLSSVYAPILEELVFRLPLKFSKRNLIIASIGLSLISFRIFSGFEYIYCVALGVGIGLVSQFLMTNKMLTILSGFWLNHRLIIFYTSLLSFSFLHLKNYEITTELLRFSPIFVLPRFLSGIFYSYIRLNSGILVAICFHAFNNGILQIISIIAE